MRAASLVFLALAACSKGEQKPKAAPAPDAAAAAAPAPAPDAAPAPARAAVRCRLHGDPLARACNAPWGTVAVDGEGRLHVMAGEKVRRYRRRAGEGCEMELEGEVAVPVVEPKGQVVGEGPLYMQSGGPQWEVTATGGRLFLHEYLRGIHEIVGDAVKPVCPGLQGAGSIAIAGKQAYLGRNDGERVTFGKTCKTAAAGFDPKPVFGVHAVGELLLGEPGRGAVIYGADHELAAKLGGEDGFAPGGICAVAAIVPCGDDLCVVDGNCKKINRYTRDGAFVAELDSSALFESFPVGLYDAAAGPDGIYLLVGYMDGEVCEDAVYLVPGP